MPAPSFHALYNYSEHANTFTNRPLNRLSDIFGCKGNSWLLDVEGLSDEEATTTSRDDSRDTTVYVVDIDSIAFAFSSLSGRFCVKVAMMTLVLTKRT